MSTIKPAIFTIATALASGAAFAEQPADTSEEQVQGSVRFISSVGTPRKEIDDFLADSRQYLGL